ncbi:DUF3329 domain-containing protein [Aurantimonas sp. HBX-1]|uniref:DUF3329 domain-containing protein n=1 Tax=Aurantimonas sp. HBX-1 TaxID=2906072 RepID=UPI001F314BC4|nr:DUF3329 domain-containing protein [Aurantimonas sp. HBX-1]UIJ73139.1 DUF3329 domain-containing protein [Aurantimonas sp. HBX-1]
MASKEAQHPFYRPLWVRIAIVSAVIGWSALEWANGETIWGVLTAGIAAWGIWMFFITYDPDAPRAPGSDATRPIDASDDGPKRD